MIHLIKASLPIERIIEEKIRDNYSWHKKIWDCFEHVPELQDRANRSEKDKGPTPFLSRYLQRTAGVELLFMSQYKPKRPSWCAQKEWQQTVLDTDYLSQPSYRFDLYANPTKTIKKPAETGGYTKNGRRITLMDVEAQRQWILKKAESSGFVIAENIPLQIDKPINHRFNRKGAKGLHIGVRFRGGFIVSDVTKFQESFIQGIGTAKGFGFGMLLIKPAQF